jgi:hypothetical protein
MELLIKKLLEEKIIIQEKADEITAFEATKPLSVYWELRSLLLLGISLFGTGIGILIYQNIDTIGHGVLIAMIAFLCGLCFWYAYKNRQAFVWAEVKNPNPLSDFALLGACVLFLILEGYVQFQYALFGDSYGLATFIPAALFIFLSYFFDHQGVLSMGITLLGSWLGLEVSPKNILSTFQITNSPLVHTAILYGFALIALGWYSEWKALKKHFSFTFYLFGANLSFMALLTALFSFDLKFAYFLLIVLLSTLCIFHARQTKSYLLLLLGVFYGYVGLSYFIFHNLNEDFALTFGYLYFSTSCGGIVYFLLNVKKILGVKKDLKL